MFHNKLFFVLILFTFFAKVGAQDLKLAKVTISELEEKQHPKDSSAVAAILYKKGKTFFTYTLNSGFVMNHEFTYRIKIYKKEGLDWATFEVPIYTGYNDINDDYVRFNDAVTYNIENGSVVKTKLNSEGSFKTKVNENWKKASISLPNVKAGSIIEFSYVLKSENILFFPVYDIQYDIPVNYSEYRTEIPNFFYYKTLLKGYLDVKTDSKVQSGSMNYTDEHNQMSDITFRSINTTYVAKDVPAIKEEAFVDNSKNYQASIHNELEKTAFPGKEVKDYSSTWEGVAKTIFKSDDFGKELKEIDYFIPDLKKLIENIKSEKERLSAVFKFVQEKMNWNGDYGYYTDKGVKKAYLDRTGNVAEINFILISMLRLTGIKVDPVLVSTIENGIPVFPNRTVFNYVIASAEINGEQILLDATNKYTTQNILPLNTLNWVGRLIKADGTSVEVSLIPKVPSLISSSLSLKIDSQRKISGTYSSRKTNHDAYDFRSKYADTSTDNYSDKLEGNYGGIEISDYSIKNKSDLMSPIDEYFVFQSDNHLEVMGSEMYLKPMLFFTLNNNPFIQEDRKTPIYFGYPKIKRYSIVIDIPEDYEVESMPKSINLSSGDGSLIFKYLLEQKDRKIQLLVHSETKLSTMLPEDYQMVKEFYQKIVDKQKENIVFKKI